MKAIFVYVLLIINFNLWQINFYYFIKEVKNGIISLNRNKVDEIILNNEYQRYRAIKNERSKYRYE